MLMKYVTFLTGLWISQCNQGDALVCCVSFFEYTPTLDNLGVNSLIGRANLLEHRNVDRDSQALHVFLLAG